MRQQQVWMHRYYFYINVNYISEDNDGNINDDDVMIT